MPTHGSLDTQSPSNSNAYSISVDAGSGANRVLLVCVRVAYLATPGGAIGVPTYDGQAMTQVDQERSVRSGTSMQMALFALVDPSSGSNTLAGSLPIVPNGDIEITSVVVEDASGIGADNGADNQAAATDPAAISIVPTEATSLLYAFYGARTTAFGPVSPVSPATEIEDNGDSDSVYQWTAYQDAGGTSATSVGANHNAGTTWGGHVVEILHAGGPAEHTGAATVSGSGSIEASGVRETLGAATITSAAVVAAAGVRGAVGQATISGAGLISAAGIAERFASAVLEAIATINADGSKETFGSAQISASAILEAVGVRETFGAGAVSGVGLITADGVARPPIISITIAGVGTITAAGVVKTPFQHPSHQRTGVTIAGSRDFKTRTYRRTSVSRTYKRRSRI